MTNSTQKSNKMTARVFVVLGTVLAGAVIWAGIIDASPSTSAQYPVASADVLADDSSQPVTTSTENSPIRTRTVTPTGTGSVTTTQTTSPGSVTTAVATTSTTVPQTTVPRLRTRAS